METGQKDKKIYYIAGTLSILVILLLIGLWYNNYFAHKDNQVKEDKDSQVKKDKDNDNEVKKDTDNQVKPNDNEVKNHTDNQVKEDKADGTAPNNVTAGPSSTEKTEMHDVLSPKQAAIDLNGVCFFGLLFVYGLFNKQIAQDRLNNPGNVEYGLAGVALFAMVVYIDSFFDSLDTTSLQDKLTLFLAMPLLCGLAMKGCEVGQCSRIVTILGISLFIGIGWAFVSWWKPSAAFSNNKLALFKQAWPSCLQWFCTACMLVDIYYQIHMQFKLYNTFGFKLMLWYIPVVFLSVQLCWSPEYVLSTSSPEDAGIYSWIAWIFSRSTSLICFVLMQIYLRKPANLALKSILRRYNPLMYVGAV